MKKNRKVFSIIAIFLVIVFSLINCGGNNRLSGTWVSEPMYDNVATISFSGKNFTITEYPAFNTEDYWWGWMSKSISGLDSNWFNKNKDQLTLNNIGWQTEIYKNVIDGTYSIIDDKIEFLFSDGEIKIHPFSRTENTMTIKWVQLTLKK